MMQAIARRLITRMMQAIARRWNRYQINRGYRKATELIAQAGYTNTAKLYMAANPDRPYYKFDDDMYDRGFLLAIRMHEARLYGLTVTVRTEDSASSYNGLTGETTTIEK